MRRRTALLLVPALAVAAVSVAAIRPSPAPPQSGESGQPAQRRLPAPVPPAFTPGRPRPLAPVRDLSHWAPVRRSVTARAGPDPAAPAVARVETGTPEGTRNIVSVLDRRTDPSGAPWVRVRLAVLPNGTTAWMPRTALGGYERVDTRLRVDLRRLRATLYKRGRPVLRVPVAVGMASWETPRGRFYVRNRLTRYRSPAYGPVAFGTSARSPRATGWPAGGFIGIHGTDRPDLVPGRVSHGCIRLRDGDILQLAHRMPVGTPVDIS